MCTISVPGASKSQKRGSHDIELKFWMTELEFFLGSFNSACGLTNICII